MSHFLQATEELPLLRSAAVTPEFLRIVITSSSRFRPTLCLLTRRESTRVLRNFRLTDLAAFLVKRQARRSEPSPRQLRGQQRRCDRTRTYFLVFTCSNSVREISLRGRAAEVLVELADTAEALAAKGRVRYSHLDLLAIRLRKDSN